MLITGRSDQEHGREAAVDRWTRLLLDPHATWERNARDIRVNETWGLAQETGEWKGEQMILEILVKTAGVYAAKWQRCTDGVWRLQSEVFTTLHCEPEHGSHGPDAG